MLGIYSIAISIFVVCATALNSGLPVTVSKLTAENLVGKKYKNIYSIITSALIISLTITLAIILVVLVTKNLFHVALTNDIVYYLIISMIPGILFTGVYAPFRGYLWGKENYLKVSLVEFIEQIIRILSCFLLFMILSKDNAIYATGLSLSIACVLSTILGIVFFFTSKGKLHSPKGFIKPVLKNSSAITGVRVVSSLMQPLLAIIIPLRLVATGLEHSQALSKLGIAMGMTMPVLMIPGTLIGSLAMALIPKISSLAKENNKTALVKQINSSLTFTLCCSFICLPIFIALGTPICMLIFKNDAAATAGEYLSNGSWLMVSMGISQLSTSILNSLGLEVKTFKYYIFSSVFLLLCIYFLPKFVGIYALMYGLGINSLIVAILNIRKINSTIGSKNTYLKPIFSLIIITIPLVWLTKFCYNILAFIFPSIIALVLVCALSLVSFAILLSVTGIIDITFIKSNMKNYKEVKLLKKHKA